ncbi:hypothetical protein ACKGJY_15215 [Hyunsoonleella sp. 2307UL5-6]|uniref:hypothetical protein n=1 Tax=Hyunsoonleella sp. 2307UL5-6 TaxID=3384768 RepID=UPI0039BD8C74
MSDSVSQSQSNVTSLNDYFNKENIIFMEDNDIVCIKSTKGTIQTTFWHIFNLVINDIEHNSKSNLLTKEEN